MKNPGRSSGLRGALLTDRGVAALGVPPAGILRARRPVSVAAAVRAMGVWQWRAPLWVRLLVLRALGWEWERWPS